MHSWMVVLIIVFVAWPAFSVVIAVLLGRFIAAGQGGEPTGEEE